MLLFLLAYLGGALTIASPCILPVLPFVFARAGQPFARSGLPLLAGMAATFSLVATAAAIGGGWVVTANQWGRDAALALMGLFAATLLFPGLSDRLTRPLVALGSRLSGTVGADTPDGLRSGPAASFLLGVATGLLWAPCAGPILGLVLTGAALGGASVGSGLLLLAYAAGAATSLSLALLAGGRVFQTMKRSLGAGEWIRKGLGAAMLAGVAVIAGGLDTGLLTRISAASTSGLEQTLVDLLSGPASAGETGAGRATALPAENRAGAAAALPDLGPAPSLDGAARWLNSPPLTMAELRGKVVLVDFWTYSCINCLRAAPYVTAWADKYQNRGLVVVGVHAPEFAFERDPANVADAVRRLGIHYPVALDNAFAIWRSFSNHYWPAHYLIDAKGRVRQRHFGEGDYDGTEQAIQALLREAGANGAVGDLVRPAADGVSRAAAEADDRSPETYLGYERTERLASGAILPDQTADYRAPAGLGPDQWSLDGRWTIEAERAILAGDQGRIAYRFHARDLHLVLGPRPDGRPVRFQVRIDGAPPGDAHGVDVGPDGAGQITGQRLYQLIRQPGPIADHTFSIEFLDPGATAYAFTFG